MKRFILTMFLAVGALAIFSATGNAQINRRYSANIPFDFSVGKKQFKAGEYTIGPLGTQTNSDFLVLTDRSTGKVQLIGQVLVDKSETDLNGKLDFVKAGDAWVLSSVETGTFSAKFGGHNSEVTKIASNRGSSNSKTVSVQ
jgi:hypothetical protein